MEREEELARLRWEQQQQQQAQGQAQGQGGERMETETEEVVMSLDGTPATAQPAQDVDGRWIVEMAQNYMEPYMAAGYEDLARSEYQISSSNNNGFSGADAGGMAQQVSSSSTDRSCATVIGSGGAMIFREQERRRVDSVYRDMNMGVVEEWKRRKEFEGRCVGVRDVEMF